MTNTDICIIVALALVVIAFFAMAMVLMLRIGHLTNEVDEIGRSTNLNISNFSEALYLIHKEKGLEIPAEAMEKLNRTRLVGTKPRVTDERVEVARKAVASLSSRRKSRT